MAAEDSEKPATRTDLALVRNDLSKVRTELKGDLAQVRTELSQVRTELKGDLAQVRTELSQVRTELKGDIARLDGKIDRVAVDLVKTQADVRDIKAAMSTKDDISRVLTAIDTFAKQTMDNRRTLLVYDDILGKHDTRITALEAKSA